MCMSSFDELVELAKRTGDRLIIHDPYTERDMVIMDVDQYKQLLMGRENVRNLSGREMIEKINREISIWRSNHEQEEREEFAVVLHEELRDMPAFDPFAECDTDNTDHTDTDWHQVGEVMQTEFPHIQFPSLELEDNNTDHNNDEVEEESAPIVFDNKQSPVFGQEEEIAPEEKQELRYEFPVHEEPEQQTQQQTYPLPQVPQEPTTPFIPRSVPKNSIENETSIFGIKKPVTESPVFFEEPL
jgi:hypothetical protein